MGQQYLAPYPSIPFRTQDLTSFLGSEQLQRLVCGRFFGTLAVSHTNSAKKQHQTKTDSANPDFAVPNTLTFAVPNTNIPFFEGGCIPPPPSLVFENQFFFLGGGCPPPLHPFSTPPPVGERAQVFQGEAPEVGQPLRVSARSDSGPFGAGPAARLFFRLPVETTGAGSTLVFSQAGLGGLGARRFCFSSRCLRFLFIFDFLERFLPFVVLDCLYHYWTYFCSFLGLKQMEVLKDDKKEGPIFIHFGGCI